MAFNPDNTILMDSMTGEIPAEHAGLIVKNVVDDSVVTKIARYEAMTKPVKKFAYLAGGPGAYWVDETEKIQTSKPTWVEAQLETRKLGVILLASNEALKWSVTNFFNDMRPEIAKAFQQKFDQAALFGTDSPYAPGISIFERAKEAGNLVTAGTEGIYNDVNAAIALVEDGDHEAQALLTTRSANKDLRAAVDGQGRPIFNDAREGVTASVLGLPVVYANKKAWDTTKSTALTGNLDSAVYGILQNIEYKISTDAQLSTITNADGTPINLYEQDMIALRATMHIAFMTLTDDAFAGIVPGTEAGA